jgi:hypothetical protein
MDVAKQQHDSREKLSIPFTGIEKTRFHTFLKATGRKAGPWMRTLAIRAIDAEEGRSDGSGQVQELPEILKGEGRGDVASRLISENASSSGGQP